MTSRFRALVASALACHAIVLFILPAFPGVFSTDSMELMKYGGHGAHVAMSHPAIYALYLLPFPAFVGMLLFKSWGRYLLIAFLALALFGSFFFGVSISGPPETFFGYLASLLDGAIVAMSYMTPLRERFTGSPIGANLDTGAGI